MTIQQYSVKKSANILCAAVRSYNYPAVTYDFQNGKEVCHENISQVEDKILSQLHSKNLQEVRDGLSNVLYWGYASRRREGNGPCDGYIPMTGRQKDRIPKFRKVNSVKISQFMEMTPVSTDPCLVRIRKINMPEYSGVSFVSKIRMFLDPENYPVLDKNIAEFGKQSGFPILTDLRIGNRIDITNKSESIYKNWASWCRGIAQLVNCELSSCHQSLRVADVERGIYQLIGSKKDRVPTRQREKNHLKVRTLLNCPEGYSHKDVTELGNKLITKN